jgi:hypothetical protein
VVVQFSGAPPGDTLFVGTKVMPRVPGTASYSTGELFNPPGCCTAKFGISCTGTGNGWSGSINFSCLACPGGAGISYGDTRPTHVMQKLPYIGNYPIQPPPSIGSSGPDYSGVTTTIVGYA